MCLSQSLQNLFLAAHMAEHSSNMAHGGLWAKSCSAQRLLSVKASMCNASVCEAARCKIFGAYRILCVKASVCKSFRVKAASCKSVCV